MPQEARQTRPAESAVRLIGQLEMWPDDQEEQRREGLSSGEREGQATEQTRDKQGCSEETTGTSRVLQTPEEGKVTYVDDYWYFLTS